jgi:hypothetical protein
MSTVFVSWSGDRSRLIAEAVASWITAVLPDGPEPFISTRLVKGIRWSEEIGKKLSIADFGIVCLTPENLVSPWLLFEAGALSNAVGNVRVCPLLFGVNTSDVDGPLSQFQATTYEKHDLFMLLKTLNELDNKKILLDEELLNRHESQWPRLLEVLRTIEVNAVPPDPCTLERVLTAFGRHGLPAPLVGGEIPFTAGFESHGLYSSVMETARDRLLIYGRKNRKIFDKEHGIFFDGLAARVATGFDFRALFLDPNAPEHVLNAAHRDHSFPEQLKVCIESARRLLERVGLNPADHCRTYCVNRTAGVIIADEAVAYSPIRLDEHGNAKGLTRASFTVTTTGSPLGDEWHQCFEDQWAVARQLS